MALIIPLIFNVRCFMKFPKSENLIGREVKISNAIKALEAMQNSGETDVLIDWWSRSDMSVNVDSDITHKEWESLLEGVEDEVGGDTDGAFSIYNRAMKELVHSELEKVRGN